MKKHSIAPIYLQTGTQVPSIMARPSWLVLNSLFQPLSTNTPSGILRDVLLRIPPVCHESADEESHLSASAEKQIEAVIGQYVRQDSHCVYGFFFWVDFCEWLLASLPPKDVFMFWGLFPSTLQFSPDPLALPKSICQWPQCLYVVKWSCFLSPHSFRCFLGAQVDFRATIQRSEKYAH